MGEACVVDRGRFDVSGVSHGLRWDARIERVRVLLLERPGMRLVEIIASTGWPPGTVSNVMSDMRERGIVSASWKEGYKVVSEDRSDTVTQ